MITRFWRRLKHLFSARSLVIACWSVLAICISYSFFGLYDAHTKIKRYESAVEELHGRFNVIFNKEDMIFQVENKDKNGHGNMSIGKDDRKLPKIFEAIIGPKVSSDAYIAPAMMLIFSLLAITAALFYTRVRSSRSKPSGFTLQKWLPHDAAEERFGSLQQQYLQWVNKYGTKRANIIYRRQLIGTIFSYYLDVFLQKTRLIDLLEKWLAPPSK